jgi:ligand-binding SRPBCC domain-containing protein
VSKLYSLRREQTFPVAKSELWSFIASPRNLARITPPYMGFEILNELGEKMHAGQIIAYSVRPLFGIKASWVTEITHVFENDYFVDEQRSGPYALWHHLHRLEEIPGGAKMTDIVHYKIPYGPVGDWVNALVVANRVKEIFDFRHEKLKALFGTYTEG